MNLFDYLLLAIAGCSMVLSLWRGFVREMISLIGLVAAFIVAGRTSGLAGNLMHGWISNNTAASVAGFALVFICVMLVVSLIGAMLRKLVDIADLTASDRTLGMVFGLARGLLLIGLFFLIYTSYAKPDASWMKESKLTPYGIRLGNVLGKAIPAGYPFSHQAKPGASKSSSATDSSADIPVPDKQQLESIIRKSMK